MLQLAPTVSIAGTARAASGEALANRPVVVTFANGVKRTVVTNAQGVYRVYDAPAGVATVDTGRASTKVSVVPGREAAVEVRFPE